MEDLFALHVRVLTCALTIKRLCTLLRKERSRAKQLFACTGPEKGTVVSKEVTGRLFPLPKGRERGKVGGRERVKKTG